MMIRRLPKIPRGVLGSLRFFGTESYFLRQNNRRDAICSEKRNVKF